MSAWSKYVAEAEQELGTAWRRYHVAAQLARLATGVITSVLWAALHAGVSDWTGLVPLATVALWATLAQMFPQVPWWLVRGLFGRGKAPASPAPTPAPPADPTSPAKG